MTNLVSTEWLSWPPLQEDQQTLAELRNIFFARALGSAGNDLDIDFYRLKRPALVTEILGNTLCASDGQPYSKDELYRWTLHRRLQGLLAVTVASCGHNTDVMVNCTHSDCGEMVEFNLDFEAFSDANDMHSFNWSPMAGYHMLIDLPTGEDQLKWSELNAADEKSAQKKIAAALVREINGQIPPSDWEITDELVAPLALEFEQRDPLTALKLNTDCPVCSKSISVDFDLEAFLLDKLKEKQKFIFEEIHYLANNYHWSEKDIVEMPAWRRTYYLTQLGVEIG
jgi:hypothetical protein